MDKADLATFMVQMIKEADKLELIANDMQILGGTLVFIDKDGHTHTVAAVRHDVGTAQDFLGACITAAMKGLTTLED